MDATKLQKCISEYNRDVESVQNMVPSLKYEWNVLFRILIHMFHFMIEVEKSK